MKEALKFLNKPLTIRWYLLTTGYTTTFKNGHFLILQSDNIDDIP